MGALAAADLVQGRVDTPPEEALGPLTARCGSRMPWGLFESANLFVRAMTFAALGGFEGWLRAGAAKELAEDTWFGWRARRSGAAHRVRARRARAPRGFTARPAGYVAERPGCGSSPRSPPHPRAARGLLLPPRLPQRPQRGVRSRRCRHGRGCGARRGPRRARGRAVCAVGFTRTHGWGTGGRHRRAVRVAGDAVSPTALAYGSIRPDRCCSSDLTPATAISSAAEREHSHEHHDHDAEITKKGRAALARDATFMPQIAAISVRGGRRP